MSTPKRQPKLTDAERHRRFKAMAKEVEASEDPKDFDKAFRQVVPPSARPPARTKSKSART
jgi:hypothetical protein